MNPPFTWLWLAQLIARIASDELRTWMIGDVLFGSSCLILSGLLFFGSTRRAVWPGALRGFAVLSLLWSLVPVLRWISGPGSLPLTLLLGILGTVGTLVVSVRLLARPSGRKPSTASVESEYAPLPLPTALSTAAEAVPEEMDIRELHTRAAELEARCAELEHQCERLREREQAAIMFVTELGQNLRTPVVSIRSEIERQLVAGAASEQSGHSLTTARFETQSLLQQLDELLEACALQAETARPEYARADLVQLLRPLVSSIAVAARARGIAFHEDLPGCLEAEFDVELLHRGLALMLEQVVRLTKSGGRITCRMWAEEAPVSGEGPGLSFPITVLELDACGLDFPPELQQPSGKPFSGWSVSVPKHPSLGLSWAVLQGVVVLHGGEIRVSVEADERFRFSVRIPTLAPSGTILSVAPRSFPLGAVDAVSEILRDAPEKANGVPGSWHPESDSARPLVLVVEDHQDLRSMVITMLEQRYRVASASNGEEGLRLARDLHPDLIISDVVMPRMAGDQMVRQIRETPTLQPVPIILLTAHNEEAMRVKMLRNGAQDYILKPFSSDELLARVENLIRFKRAREVLESELRQQSHDIEALAREAAGRKRELEALVRTLEVALQHAERASRIKTNFLRVASHELRTPLTVMSLESQLLRRYLRASLSEREQRTLDQLDLAIRRLQELIDGMLEYAHVESGIAAPHVEPLDVASLVSEVAGNWQPQAAGKGLKIRCRVAEGLPPLRSDERMLRLILSQLGDNAVKFTEQGVVEIVGDWVDGCFRITVRDTGGGIPPEQRAAIFEPFEHLETMRAKHTPGMGLGLALVQELVRTLQGRIELDSTVGSGSVFMVILPNLP